MASQAPTNLTVLADKYLPQEAGPSRAEVFSHPRLTAEIVVGHHQDASSHTEDETYVIVSGYGVLRAGDGLVMEITQGDVVFVPAGSEMRFDSVSAGFKTWRIATGGRL